MIEVNVEILVLDLNDDRLEVICDGFSDVDPVLDDLLDWSVGADIQTGKIEIDMTLNSETPDAAVVRSKEILNLVMELSGFSKLELSDASKITAEVVAA